MLVVSLLAQSALLAILVLRIRWLCCVGRSCVVVPLVCVWHGLGVAGAGDDAAFCEACECVACSVFGVVGVHVLVYLLDGHGFAGVFE